MGLINAIGAFFRKVTGGWEFGTQISKLLFTKNVEIIGTDDMLYEYQFQEKSGTIAHLDDIPNIVFEDARLEGGFVTWSEENFLYDVSTVIIRLNNTTYTVPEQQVDLIASPVDPTLSRIDLVYATPDGIFVRQGIEALDPVAPQIIAGEEIFLTTILVLGGTTEPGSVNGTVIYRENTGQPEEWNITFNGNGTGVSNSLNTPFQGFLNIETTNIQNNFEVRADRTTLFDLVPFDFVSFRIRLKANMGTGQNLYVVFRNDTDTAVTSEVLVNLNKSLVGVDQHIIIPVSAFSPTGLVQKAALMFRRTSGSATYGGYFLDDWFLQGNAVVVPPPPDDQAGVNMVDVTYAELHTLIDSSQLIAGAFYKVTDFSTIHRILNTVDINFGPIEPMVTFATASDQVSSFARSITYPQDIIEINWNSRLAEDGITPRAGTIVYREDTLRRIRVQGFDFRNTRWRRWKILSKQYEVPVATGPDSFTITLTFSANLTATYLDRYREWSVKFPVDAVHDAGPINITVTKGAFTFTRPLLQSNNSTTWTANQLANLTGPLVYCPVRDVFLLMNIGQTGEQLVGFYLARLGGALFTVGNNVRFDVDPNDFMDYTTFDDTRTILDVNIWGRCDNNVFFGNVNMFTIETYGLNNTFRGNVNFSSLKIWSYNNIFNSTWDWSTPQMEVQNNLVLTNMAYFDVGAWTYNNTIVFTGNYYIDSRLSFAACTIIAYISFFECHYGAGSSGIFLSGGISQGFRVLRGISSTLIGYFNGSGVVIDRTLTNTSIYEKPLAQLSLSSVNINNLLAPQGPVSPLGIDSEGNVVPGSSIVTISGTYAEIKALQDSSSLVTGSPYVITDFQTIHLIEGTTDINIGPIEPLLLRASSTSGFSVRADSLLYPNDEIGFDFEDNICEDGITPRKGFITYRKDIINSIELFIDWRHVKYRRWKVISRSFTEGYSVDPNTVAIDFTSNRPNFGVFPNNFFKYEVSFQGVTHDAGDLFITLNFANGSATKPLHLFSSLTWTANQLNGLSGSLLYNTVKDSFVLMSYGNIGANLFGKYVCPIQPVNSIWTIGNLTSFIIDNNDFEDFNIFNGLTIRNVFIGNSGVTSNLLFNYNNVIFSSCIDSIWVQGSYRSTYGIHTPTTSISRTEFAYVANSVFETSLQSSVLRTIQSTYQVHHPTGFSQTSHTIGQTFAVTMRLPILTILAGFYEQFSYIPNGGYGAHFTERSFCLVGAVFINGSNLGANVPQRVTIDAGLQKTLIGYFTANNLRIERNLDFTAFDETNVDASHTTDSLSVPSLIVRNALPVPTGDIRTLGLDSTNNLVQAPQAGTISITHAALIILKNSNSLLNGVNYLITDFQTIHQIQETTDINTGSVEPLMIIATSANTFGTKAYSALFPDDIIEYDFDDILCEDGTTPRKGKILFRHDLINDVYTYYDWRNVRFRRWKVTGRRDETLVQISPTEFEINLVYRTLVVEFRIHLTVEPDVTHPEGELFVTIYGNEGPITRRLVKEDGNPIWLANEIANRTGVLVRDLQGEDRIFLFYRQFGQEIIGSYVSNTLTTLQFSPGMQNWNLQYDVDNNDFTDYLTFNGGTNKNVHLESSTYYLPNHIGNNVVFLNNVTSATFNVGCFNNSFRGIVNHCYFYGGRVFGNMFVSNVTACEFNSEVVYNYLIGTNGLTMNGAVMNNVIQFPQYIVACNGSINRSYLFITGTSYTVNNYITDCTLLIGGSGSGGAIAGINLLSHMGQVYIARVNGNGLTIDARLDLKTIYSLKSYTFLTNRIKINTLENYIPISVKLPGIDENGYLIEHPPIDLQYITENGAFSPIPITHAPGVNPNDSATVSQLDQLEQDIATTINTRTFGIDLDGSGSPVSTGLKGYIVVPYACEIVSWSLVADTVGSIEIDVWKSNVIPNGANTICAGNRPRLVAQQLNTDAVLTGWDKIINQGDIIAFNVVSSSTVTKVNLVIKTNLS